VKLSSDKSMRPLVVLGVDTGFSTYGLSRVEIFPEIRVRAFTTLRYIDKGNDLKATERMLSVGYDMSNQVHTWIDSNFKDNPPIAVAVEGVSIPQKVGPQTTLKIGIGWGTLLSVASRLGVPVFQRFPAAIKQHLTGKKSASKKEIQAVLSNKFCVDFEGMNLTLREHAADSIAAAITVAQQEKMVGMAISAIRNHVST